MDDGNVPDVSNAPAAPVEKAETTEQVSQPAEQTAEVPETNATPDVAPERTVPVSVLQKERKQRQELQRKIAELQGKEKLSQYDPNDLEQVLAHPAVQELLLKDAKRELTDYAREALDEFPTLHPALKKAILKNARGFVNETTTDVESAKLDLLQYIESVVEETSATPAPVAPKNLQVATTNAQPVQASGRPAEVAKILEKPIDEWTEDDVNVVETYTKTQKKGA